MNPTLPVITFYYYPLLAKSLPSDVSLLGRLFMPASTNLLSAAELFSMDTT